MPEAVIVAAARSPIGRAHKGSLRSIRGDDMAAAMARAAFDQIPSFDPHELDDLLLGCGQPAGEQGYNMARIVAVLLGLDDVPGVTVQRYCASSLQTTRMAMHAIRAGEGHAFLSVGVEAVSRYRKGKSDGLPGTRNEFFDAADDRTRRAAQGGVGTWTDPRDDGVVPDAYIAMGQTAENVALSRMVSRVAQDEYACLSQNRAEKAIANGFWERDITPLALPDGTVVDSDDCPREGVTMAALSELTPVFRPNGTVTAGNCCPLNDGAAALVIMSDTRAHELGIEPLGRIVATGVSGLSPEIMGMGPVPASKQALSRAGMSIDDIDLVEINEAFAAQVLPSVDDLGVDIEKVNVHGGAISVGHPFGMTGARITTTLLHALRSRDAAVGLETMCVGGGQGMAMIIERLT